MYARKNIGSFVWYYVHTLDTRNINKLRPPRLHKVSDSFMRNCIHFYNKLPDGIDHLSMRKYKLLVKINLIKKYTIQ